MTLFLSERRPPEWHEGESGTRSLALLVGDEKGVMFDGDAEIAALLERRVLLELAEKLPGAAYSGEGRVILDSVHRRSSTMLWKLGRTAKPAAPPSSELAARRAQKEAEKAEILRQARARKIAYQAPRLPQPAAITLLNDEEAERWCAAWMRHLGATDAKVTRFVADGGIDIVSSRYVAQVKNYVGSVGVKDVRELKGVAAVEGRIPLFFTSGRYTRQAMEFAKSANVALFRYNAQAGEMKPVCDRAKTLLRNRM